MTHVIPSKQPNIGIIMGVTALVSALGFALFFYFNYNQRGAGDVVDKPNDKIPLMFQVALNKELERYKSNWYPGCLPTAPKAIEDFFNFIKSLETYSRYGINSGDRYNNLYIRIVFNNGTIKDEIYTGKKSHSATLIKLLFVGGKVEKSFTNGLEMNSSPENMKGTLEYLVVSAIHLDYDMHRSSYFFDAKPKTKEDFKDEWDNVK